LADWNEVEKWQNEINNARKHVQETDIQHAMKLNADMNYIRYKGKHKHSSIVLLLTPHTCAPILSKRSHI